LASTTVKVEASYGGTSQAATVTVAAMSAAVSLSSIQISPAELTSGATAALTLTLSGPAPTGDGAVSVSSGDGVVFPALAFYAIPAGQTSASFTVVTGTVSSARTVTVQAEYGGASASSTITVDPSRVRRAPR